MSRHHAGLAIVPGFPVRFGIRSSVAPVLPRLVVYGLDIGGLVTVDDTPTLTGKYFPAEGDTALGVIIHILIADVEVGTTTCGADGTWSYTFAALPAGSYDITAEADYPTELSDPITITIDAVASDLDEQAALLLCGGGF